MGIHDLKNLKYYLHINRSFCQYVPDLNNGFSESRVFLRIIAQCFKKRMVNGYFVYLRGISVSEKNLFIAFPANDRLFFGLVGVMTKRMGLIQRLIQGPGQTVFKPPSLPAPPVDYHLQNHERDPDLPEKCVFCQSGHSRKTVENARILLDEYASMDSQTGCRQGVLRYG